ncbi:MAG: bifunctional phosphopantothenoylcysteine decarboxylase/phosphopantothenate--cysteine ligase CoaBC [Bacteroidales bacterium]|jgi:phosphopantothenoylcysteine decarboxylase/phosphopantothenate--cysteine ligase|nr:bifunctional phosphopantothenoylcysteine decarboxylase/phosphopantothenate--cysteine ligase CoaBC [Bacteroidales bacterium]MBP5420468.1 bifunctional phosphopantothenoylcysteine decarboxylase/phosphopantothenate--cysteine ligase CoaBC [Bacteroidales bacterium]
MLKGKKIIVGVCGGIAAYKTAYLVREIVKQGGEVRVVMTQMAKQFITPLTMATLSKNPIMVDFFDPENGAWNSHVGLGTWADAMVIAPATANTIAKMANGIADNLLLTTYLSARCPIIIAPAMDLDMYAHPATQQNIDLLKQRGVVVVDPDAGELASGLSGKGRMAEPESIAETIDDVLAQIDTKLKGKRIMVTAGPTYERIDPVRFIGNYSSGKMGYAIAEELAKRGAIVELISGPVKIAAKRKNIIVTKTESAAEMYAAACEIFPKCKGAIMSAAVADFTPSQCADSKIKNKQTMQITLVPTPDIAAAMGKMKQKTQFLVGFALETDHEEINALEKLQKKNLDFIVLNSLRDAGAGFMTDTNKVTIYHRDGVHIAYELKPKAEVASDIVNSIERYIND